MSAQLKKIAFPLALIFLSVISILILNISTPAGAGLANDSAAYIAGARSILAGTGYSDIWLDSSLEPITHYPPLLSLCLAGIGYFGIDPLRGIRLLNIFLFGANTFLSAVLAWQGSRSKATGVWAGILFFTSAILLRVHLFALSEGLYIFLSLLVFLFFSQYEQIRPVPGKNEPHSFFWSKSLWLFSAGVTSGLAFLSRYSALALFPTFIITIFTIGTTWKQKLQDTGLYISSALPLIAAWFIRNKLTAGNATNRVFQFHPISFDNINPGLYNASLFLLPVESLRTFFLKSGIFFPILILMIAVILLWLGWKTKRMIFQQSSSTLSIIPFTTALYFFAYISAIFFSMSFFDASTKLQPRILAPLFVVFIFLLTFFFNWLWNNPSIQQSNYFVSAFLKKMIILVLTITITCANCSGLISAVNEYSSAGQGYASWKWHDSIVMNELKKLKPGTIIYTNTPPAVYLVTGLSSRTLPSSIDPVDKIERPGFNQDVAEMREALLNGRAVLVFFDETPVPSQDLTENQGSTSKNNYDKFIAGLTILRKTQGDVMYGIK